MIPKGRNSSYDRQDKKGNGRQNTIKLKTEQHESHLKRLLGGVECHFQQYLSYIVAVSFIGGGKWSTWRKPLTCRKSLTNFIT